MSTRETIPRSMHRDVIDSYWVMMSELMTKADNDNDTTLKVMVEGFFKQWNRITRSDNKPIWMTRNNDRKQQHSNSD